MAGISKVKYNTKKGIVEKYTVTYRDIYGKQHSKGMYDTKREAKKHLNEFNNIHPDILDITFEDIFRPFLEYAKENKFIAVNNIVVSPQEKHHLTEAQEKEVLQACKELYPKYHSLFTTLMGTGMRIGELLALEVTDVNFENKSIKVNKQFTKGKFKDGTKNPARVVQIKERDVYITDDIIVILHEHIKSLPEGTKILFPSQVNGYLSDTNLRIRVWQPLLAYVGITDRIRLHDLRGSYADIALEHGASIKFIQNQLGHAKAQTTLDIYMKNNDDTIKNALEQMNGVFTND